jgi:hypothetical protein
MMLMLEPMVVMVYELEMMTLIVVVEVEQQVDKVNEIHVDRNQYNDDQQKENHCTVVVEHDDVHDMDIDHYVLWKTVVGVVEVVAAAVVVLVVVHCYYSKGAVVE